MARVGYGDRLAGGGAGASAQFGTGGKSQKQIDWDFMWMSPQKFRATYGISKKKYEQKLAKRK